MSPLTVIKSRVCFLPDSRRVIAKAFWPGGDSEAGRERTRRIVSRVLGLSDTHVASALASVLRRYGSRHKNLQAVFEDNVANITPFVEGLAELPSERRLLIGAYFSHEYSIEGAALSNPSIVEAPNQLGLALGERRFVLSLRAIGEGHISSIEFRSGVIDGAGRITPDEPSPHVGTGRRRAPTYDKFLFGMKLAELSALNDIAQDILGRLPDHFNLLPLEELLHEVEREHGSSNEVLHTNRTIHWLASSNYESTFAEDSKLSERVLFPSGPTESHGMEDARFVRFVADDGSVRYFATYTAYDGYQILPQLIETPDFQSFRIATLNGACAKNKGMALFPRRIGGRFAALARLDNENNFFMWSDNVRFWQESERIQVPKYAWEMTQLGNCGSPLETDEGWLVITHGVGAMREYVLGAILLDKDQPSRVIGHLDVPLLTPAEDERDGYVPNVVYSCGSMITGGLLVLPYGFADVGARIATVRVDELLARLTRS